MGFLFPLSLVADATTVEGCRFGVVYPCEDSASFTGCTPKKLGNWLFIAESTSLYEHTRLINDSCNYEDKLKLISGLWNLAFADQELDKYEEYLIRKIADLLHVSHSDFIKEKMKVKEGL